MNQLLKTLLTKQLIPYNTKLTGRCHARYLGGTQKVLMTVYLKNLKTNGFMCTGELGEEYLMRWDDLKSIDGMDPTRYAKVYNIKEDGSTTSSGKKRGRKPKAA
jgi:hypothetical protein